MQRAVPHQSFQTVVRMLLTDSSGHQEPALYHQQEHHMTFYMYMVYNEINECFQGEQS